MVFRSDRARILKDRGSHAQSGAEQDPFEGMEFKSAVAGQGPTGRLAIGHVCPRVIACLCLGRTADTPAEALDQVKRTLHQANVQRGHAAHSEA